MNVQWFGMNDMRLVCPMLSLISDDGVPPGRQRETKTTFCECATYRAQCRPLPLRRCTLCVCVCVITLHMWQSFWMFLNHLFSLWSVDGTRMGSATGWPYLIYDKLCEYANHNLQCRGRNKMEVRKREKSTRRRLVRKAIWWCTV